DHPGQGRYAARELQLFRTARAGGAGRGRTPGSQGDQARALQRSVDPHGTVTAPRLFAVVLLAATTASAQHDPYRSDVAYDGRFTFVRLRWKSDFGFSRRGFSSAWNHDYPRAEPHPVSSLSAL